MTHELPCRFALRRKSWKQRGKLPHQEACRWCLGSTSRICLAFACQPLSLEVSMHRVPKTCCLHHKSPSKVSGHPEHLLHVSPAQNCEDRKARFRKQRLGANLEKNMSDRLLSLLEISAPLDGSWHGLSSKCLYTAGLRTKDWSSFAELVSDGFLEGRA